MLMPDQLSPEIATSRRTIPALHGDTPPREFVVRMDQPLTSAIEHLERSMIQYALDIAGEPTQPSLLTLKRTSISDSQNIGEAQRGLLRRICG